jgi:response regulator RpfG family c-di-GMP phosphodiesterase
LIVEDLARQMRRLFHSQNIEMAIDTAQGASDALALMRQNESYAVILSDFLMPGMNGVELLTRSHRMQPDAVRLILTGYPTVDAAVAAINEGRVSKFLTKPCSPEDLAKVVMASIEEFRISKIERNLLARAAASQAPLRTCLHPNYPNPFENSTTIPFDLASASKVQIQVFDEFGTEIQLLVEASLPSGNHSVEWKPSNCAPSIYLCRMEADDFVGVQRMLLSIQSDE